MANSLYNDESRFHVSYVNGSAAGVDDLKPSVLLGLTHRFMFDYRCCWD